MAHIARNWQGQRNWLPALCLAQTGCVFALSCKAGSGRLVEPASTTRTRSEQNGRGEDLLYTVLKRQWSFADWSHEETGNSPRRTTRVHRVCRYVLYVETIEIFKISDSLTWSMLRQAKIQGLTHGVQMTLPLPLRPLNASRPSAGSSSCSTDSVGFFECARVNEKRQGYRVVGLVRCLRCSPFARHSHTRHP